MPAAKKKTKTKKTTTTNKGVKKSTKKVTAKSPTKKNVKTTKTSIKKAVEKTTTPKKLTKKKTVTPKSDTKKVSRVKQKTLENTIELPKTKEQVRIEEETKQLELKKALQEKLALEETLEQTAKLNLPANKKNKKKSNAKNIARNKTNAFIKKLKKLQRKIKIYGIESVVPKKYLISTIIILLLVVISIVSINLIKPTVEKINLDTVAKEIDQVKVLKYDISNTTDIIEASDSYNKTNNKVDLKQYYEYDFDEFNLKRSWIDDFRIFYNEKSKQLFMVFKPLEDNTNNITENIEKFLKTKKITATKEEYDGYIFYISSKDDKKVISKIKQNQVKAFDYLKELNKEDIKEEYGIDSSLYKDYKVKTTMVVKNYVTEYLIFYPKNQKCAKEIAKLMDKYYQAKETKWASDEENLKLIQNRYVGNYNGYLIYVVSKDNDLVIQLLKK